MLRRNICSVLLALITIGRPESSAAAGGTTATVPVSAWSLATVRIPKVKIESKTLAGACEQLKDAAKVYYPDLPELVFRFEGIDGSQQVDKLKLDLTDESIYDILRYISEIALCGFEPQENVLMFRKIEPTPSLKRRYVLTTEMARDFGVAELAKQSGLIVGGEALSEKFGLHVLDYTKLSQGLVTVVCVGPPSAHAEIERSLRLQVAPSPYLIKLPGGAGVRSR